MESLKLSRIEAQKLNDKEKGMIMGGLFKYFCGCGCQHRDEEGGASIEANAQANRKGDYTPPEGVETVAITIGDRTIIMG